MIFHTSIGRSYRCSAPWFGAGAGVLALTVLLSAGPVLSQAPENEPFPGVQSDEGAPDETNSGDDDVIEFEPQADPTLLDDYENPDWSGQPAEPYSPGEPNGQQEATDPNEPVEIETLDLLPPPKEQAEEGEETAEVTRVPVSATLRALEKITAKYTDLNVAVGDSVDFERLSITLDTCDKRPPEDPPEVTAFLEVVEHKLDGDDQKLFTGWMFASSPGLNGLEDPVYDVWVIDCKMREPEQGEGSE